MANNTELDQNTVENQTDPTAQILSIELTIQEINVVFAALQELPHRVSDPILRNLMEQAQKQVQPAL